MKASMKCLWAVMLAVAMLWILAPSGGDVPVTTTSYAFASATNRDGSVVLNVNAPDRKAQVLCQIWTVRKPKVTTSALETVEWVSPTKAVATFAAPTGPVAYASAQVTVEKVGTTWVATGVVRDASGNQLWSSGPATSYLTYMKAPGEAATAP